MKEMCVSIPMHVPILFGSLLPMNIGLLQNFIYLIFKLLYSALVAENFNLLQQRQLLLLLF
jgi:hypothetical protein